MQAPDDPSASLPMRLVERRTGLGADLLRAWERRYGAVHPARSAGGQRLYRDADIERLLLLKRLTEEGHSIGTIAARSLAGLIATANTKVQINVGAVVVATGFKPLRTVLILVFKTDTSSMATH